MFIYFIEEHHRFLPIVRPLFEEADRGRRQLVTSVLTLMEVLVAPYRAGDRALARRYDVLLTRSRGVRLVDFTREHFRAAAQLRAVTAVKTPDALQLVSAMAAGCTTFVTNDRRLPPVTGLRVLLLDDFDEP
ncbi:MAG: PIN domain-containing protein [Acidobacteriota bacterium]|nr:PIN domain-containing protein [Acidobacteriota bacterium]